MTEIQQKKTEKKVTNIQKYNRQNYRDTNCKKLQNAEIPITGIHKHMWTLMAEFSK